jgi:DNA adenine methylase
VNKADCILRWHGSKRQLAPTIVKLFPRDYEKMVYVEPFCGSAAVFFAKRPSKLEVLNDLDEELVNFLMTVKLHPRELVHALRLVPNSRVLFAEMFDVGARFSTIVRAARWFYLNMVSFGGLRESWAAQKVGGGGQGDVSRFPSLIFRAAVRLRGARIESQDANSLIKTYDHQNVMFYIDPPYLGCAPYAIAFGDAGWNALKANLARIEGKFVLSTEASARMKLLWRGFHQRVIHMRGTFGVNDRVQKELLVWNC